MSKKRGSQWRARQDKDPFVKARDRSGYRARSAFKLIEMADKYQLLEKGAAVLDIGAAPGGWAQVAAQRVMPGGLVIGLDLDEISPLADVITLQGDCRDSEMHEQIGNLLAERRLDLVMSDMAPNISGIRAADIARSLELAEVVAELADDFLKPHGNLIVKLFQHADTDEYIRQVLRPKFGKIIRRKPEASRSASKEFYVVAQEYEL